MKKHFWQSRKFIYASGMIIAEAFITLLPQFVDVTPETIEALHFLAICVAIGGMALIMGHTLTDVAAILAGAKANVPANIRDAVNDLVDAVITEDGAVTFTGVPLQESADPNAPREAVK